MGENFWQRFARLGKGEGPGKGQRSTWFILLLAVMGIVFMFISANPEQDRIPRPVQDSDKEVAALPRSKGDYRERLEKDLEDRLQRMRGVDEVSVLVTLESGPVSEYAQNKETTERSTTEEDGAGGQRDVSETTIRNQAVMARDGSGDDAVVTRQLEPQIRGVMVIARGAENPVVKEQITLAVEAALNISAHRVHVVPMK